MADNPGVEAPALPDIIDRIMHHCDYTRRKLSTMMQKTLIDIHFYEAVDEVAVYLARHPIFAIFLLAIAISCGIPILMFVLFAVLTVILTFTGFIMIEGTILTLGSVVLCGFLLAMVIVMVTLAATIGIAYVGFLEIYGLLQNSPEDSPLARLLPQKLKNGIKQSMESYRAAANNVRLAQQHRED